MIAAVNMTILDFAQFVPFGDKNFEVVNEFEYLGALVTLKNDVGLKTQQRIKITNRCFCGPQKNQRSSGTSDKVNDLQDLDPPGPVRQ
jgi:hypothetical protein